MNKLKKYFLLLICCFLLFNAAYAFDKINYAVDMTNSGSHFFGVSVTLDNLTGDSVDLLVPKIIPGTYSYENYAKNVQEFSARGDNDKPLKWEKIDLHAWRVYLNGSKSASAKYRVYGSEVSIFDSFINTRQAMINSGLLMYPKAGLEKPCQLNLKYPEGWKIATTLNQLSEYAYTAPDYHYLIDRPVMLGNFRETKFTYKGAEYILALDEALVFDAEKLTADIEKIAKEEIDMMGGVPFKKYIFFYLYGSRHSSGAGGLEHSDNTVMIIDPYAQKGLDGVYGLTAHEFFHLWNDKNIYAKNVYPFRYNDTDYTRLYWFFEGFTSYYDDLMVARCGLYNAEKYYKTLSSALGRYLDDTLSAKYISAEDASLTGFFHMPDNNSENFLDFYLKGSLIALVADLQIRHKTQNKKSLDDVMRYMYKNYGLKGKGIPDDGIQQIFEKATGVNLDNIFKNYVKDTKKIDFNKYLNYAGLKLEVKEKNIGGWLGISGCDGGEGYEIESIERDSPAYKAGLSAGDIIAAVNGVKVTSGNFINNFKPYEKVEITLFRNNILMSKQAFPGKKGTNDFKIVEIKNPDKLQKEILKSWLGE